MEGVHGDNHSQFLDDTLIATQTVPEHLVNLEQILKAYTRTGLIINIKKSKLIQTEVEYLGQLITENGIKVNPRHIEAIQKIQYPCNIKQLRALLGHVNYFRKFFPYFAEMADPLYQILQGRDHTTPKSTPKQLNKEQKGAVDTFKRALTSTPF